MDVARQIETRFKVSRNLLAFLAIVFGLLILFFPWILSILIGLFLIVWGLVEATKSGTRAKTSTASS